MSAGGSARASLSLDAYNESLRSQDAAASHVHLVATRPAVLELGQLQIGERAPRHNLCKGNSVQFIISHMHAQI